VGCGMEERGDRERFDVTRPGERIEVSFFGWSLGQNSPFGFTYSMETIGWTETLTPVIVLNQKDARISGLV